MPELALDSDLGCTGKEGHKPSSRTSYRFFFAGRSTLFTGRGGAPLASPPHQLIDRVMVNAYGNGIKDLQERSCSKGAPSFQVLVVLGSIDSLGLEDGSVVALEVLDETEPRYHAWGMSLALGKYLQGLWWQDKP